MKIKLLVIILSLLLMASTAFANGTMIIVVRHAEKSTDDRKDPNLSQQGIARANKLATILKDSNLNAVYTTQYKRTQQTGLPAATQSGLQLEVRHANTENAKTYTSDLLKEIQKKHRGKTILIIGHSNTVPEIVKHLSNVDVTPIGENEFDRLYLITLGKKSRLVSVSYNP
jgi:broad specificity phosphatase PhoE